jgi:hypothetical protein
LLVEFLDERAKNLVFRQAVSDILVVEVIACRQAKI